MKNILLSMTCGQKSHVVEITHRFPVDLHTFSEVSETLIISKTELFE